MEWAETWGISIRHIQPGKPQQNADIEHYNRTVWHEWLDQYIIDWINTSLRASNLSAAAANRLPVSGRHITSPRNGYEPTTMNAPTSLSWSEGKPIVDNGASAA
jgi:hypothetical protein